MILEGLEVSNFSHIFVHNRCELEPRSVALHPWGYEVLVGLPRNVSIFRIMATKYVCVLYQLP